MKVSGADLVEVLLLVVMTGSQTYAAEVQDFCESENFNPICAQNEVVMITHARYGRMRPGRCVTGEHGNFNCDIDAKLYMDSVCSGKRTCDVTVATLVPETAQECSKDLRSYLEVVYECVKVVYATRDYCTNIEAVQIKEKEGYLSSLITMETGCGSFDSPWWVAVEPGQTIKLTLYDFGRLTIESTCHVYAVIKEEASQITETVCASHLRERTVFESASNKLIVRIVTRTERPDSHFLLKFEAEGCPDLKPPPNGKIVRRGNDVVITCDDTGDREWRLRCRGRNWTGAYHNCTQGPYTAGATQGQWTLFGQSHVLSVLIILCIAVIVGLCILAIGLIYLRRKRRARDVRETVIGREAAEIQYGSRPPAADKPPISGAPISRHYNKTGDSTEFYHSAENDYYRTWQMQRHAPQMSPLPAPPPVASIPPPYSPPAFAHAHTSAGRNGHGNGNGNGYQRSMYPPNEHIYESPKFERKDYSSDDYEGDVVHTEYFELDPESSKMT